MSSTGLEVQLVLGVRASELEFTKEEKAELEESLRDRAVITWRPHHMQGLNDPLRPLILERELLVAIPVVILLFLAGAGAAIATGMANKAGEDLYTLLKTATRELIGRLKKKPAAYRLNAHAFLVVSHPKGQLLLDLWGAGLSNDDDLLRRTVERLQRYWPAIEALMETEEPEAAVKRKYVHAAPGIQPEFFRIYLSTEEPQRIALDPLLSLEDIPLQVVA